MSSLSSGFGENKSMEKKKKRSIFLHESSYCNANLLPHLLPPAKGWGTFPLAFTMQWWHELITRLPLIVGHADWTPGFANILAAKALLKKKTTTGNKPQHSHLKKGKWGRNHFLGPQSPRLSGIKLLCISSWTAQCPAAKSRVLALIMHKWERRTGTNKNDT